MILVFSSLSAFSVSFSAEEVEVADEETTRIAFEETTEPESNGETLSTEATEDNSSNDLVPVGADYDIAVSGYSIPSEADFLRRLNELRSVYPNGGRYSGTYYENGVAKAWQCHGYACQLLEDIFGIQYYNGGFYSRLDYNMGTLYAGDLVRINSNSHTIFITKVLGDRIYYTEANMDYNNGIRWDSSYTTSEMASRFTYKMHLDGNYLTGNGSPIPSNPWFSSNKSVAVVGGSVTFAFGANDATNYTIGIDKDGTRIITEGVSSGKSYTFNSEGTYSAYVSWYFLHYC